METNNQGEYYKPVILELWDFTWTTFISEVYDPEQKFIFVFNDGDEIIMKYANFMDCDHLTKIGVKKYLPINF